MGSGGLVWIAFLDVWSVVSDSDVNMCGLDCSEFVARKIGLKMGAQRKVSVMRRKGPKRVTRQSTREKSPTVEKVGVTVPKVEVTVPSQTVDKHPNVDSTDDECSTDVEQPTKIEPAVSENSLPSKWFAYTVALFIGFLVFTTWFVVFVDLIELMQRLN
jgi:hypothetical protein